jgi:hypothetical protein
MNVVRGAKITLSSCFRGVSQKGFMMSGRVKIEEGVSNISVPDDAEARFRRSEKISFREE